MTLLLRFLGWIDRLVRREPVRLAVVRRYRDANGAFVGELYLHETTYRKHDIVTGYTMIGASLDTLPLGLTDVETDVFELDTDKDFLSYMPPMTLRVGGLEPKDNDGVRAMVSRMPRRGMTLLVQNRFIEHVMDDKERR